MKKLIRTVPAPKGDDSVVHEDVSPDTVSSPIELIDQDYCDNECKRKNTPGECDKCREAINNLRRDSNNEYDGTV